jgi:hypothetical protein
MTQNTENKSTWGLLLPEVAQPSDQQWSLWSALHDPKTITAGITQLAAKYRRMGGRMDSDYVLKFASSVMNRFSRDQREGKPPLQ